MIEIIPYQQEYNQEVKKFIFEILEKEFHLENLQSLLPDLHDIENVYQQNGGNFWIILKNEKVVGTIGFRDYGNGQGYIKRMYIDQELRRNGLGKELLETVLSFAKEKNFHTIFVGTKEEMAEANAFYAKNHFQKVEKFPENIPTFGDPMLYILHL